MYTLFQTLFLSNEMFAYDPEDTGKAEQHFHRSLCVETNMAVKLVFSERKWLQVLLESGECC